MIYALIMIISIPVAFMALGIIMWAFKRGKKGDSTAQELGVITGNSNNGKDALTQCKIFDKDGDFPPYLGVHHKG